MSFTRAKDLGYLSPKSRIFFFRICGTLMGACATLLKDMGYQVEGCDYTYYPPMSNYLNEKEIQCYQVSEIDEEKLKEYDLIVVGNSLSGKSEDARMVERSGVPMFSAPRVLGEILLKNREVIGVCGTHGKTTTTFLMLQVLKKLGENPGYLIGGVLDGMPSASLGSTPYFLIESDEYDTSYFEKFSKFHLYQLDHVLLTSLEFDHADIYDSIDDIKNEFLRLFAQLRSSLFYSLDYPVIQEVLEKKSLFQSIHHYGDTSESGPRMINESPEGSLFEITWKEENFQFKTNLIGKHNIFNLSAVILWCLNKDFPVDQIQEACLDLSLVKRRQEVRGHYKGSVVIDDFAHHPRAVDLTLKGLKTKYAGKKLIAILEPISATARSQIFEQEFTDALRNADISIIVKPSFETSVKDQKTINTARMSTELSSAGIESYNVEELKNLRILLSQLADENSVIVVMSNRTCLGLWESDFVQEII